MNGIRLALKQTRPQKDIIASPLQRAIKTDLGGHIPISFYIIGRRILPEKLWTWRRQLTSLEHLNGRATKYARTAIAKRALRKLLYFLETTDLNTLLVN
jgi:hypothetical protein